MKTYKESFAITETETIIKTIRKLPSLEEFTEKILAFKPYEIYCSQWSEKRPFLVIKHYDTIKNEVCYMCNANATTAYRTKKISEIYRLYQYSGLSDFYFNAIDLLTPIID